MNSSTLKTHGCLLLALSLAFVADAQTQPPKKSGSISGKVSFKDSGISGIAVGAIYNGRRGMGRTRFSAVTDTQGNYRISDLPPGTYELMPVAPQFVLAASNMSNRVILEEGETLDGIDFTLVRGGVISGKVTNADGQPLIEERVQLAVLEAKTQTEPMMRMNMYNQTDDRGMYRIFGLAPGKYTVSAGTPQNSLDFGGGRSGVKYRQTFHPSVTDPSQATVIEVTEGSEATNVDIVISSRQTTYSASGRVIDGETGRPVPNARYGIAKIAEHGSSGTSGPTTNALGEFKIDNLTAGKYMLTLEHTRNDFITGNTSNVYADAVFFELTDQDVTDLVIKTSRGASVSGVVAFDGLDQKTVRQKFGQLMITANLLSNDRLAAGRSAPLVNVGLDGSFTLGGLAAGAAHFTVLSQTGSENGRQFEVARIERDGVTQQRTLDIKEREQITGVRVVINTHSGTLQGIVKVENGQVPSGRLYVSLTRSGRHDNSGFGISLDVRGRFRMGGLPAGTYDVTAYAYMPDSRPRSSTKQQVVIIDEQVTEITLTLDLKSASTRDRP